MSAKEQIEAAADVRRLVELVEVQPGTWLYLIETVWETFPRFVVGRYFPADETAWPEAKCGEEWNGRRLFEEARAKFSAGQHGRSHHVTIVMEGAAK